MTGWHQIKYQLCRGDEVVSLHFDKKLFCILPQCDKLGCQPWAKRETSLSVKDRIKSPGRDKSVKKHYARVPLQINLQDKKLLNENSLKLALIQ